MKKDVPAAVDVVLEDFLVWKKISLNIFSLILAHNLETIFKSITGKIKNYSYFILSPTPNDLITIFQKRN